MRGALVHPLTMDFSLSLISGAGEYVDDDGGGQNGQKGVSFGRHLHGMPACCVGRK